MTAPVAPAPVTQPVGTSAQAQIHTDAAQFMKNFGMGDMLEQARAADAAEHGATPVSSTPPKAASDKQVAAREPEKPPQPSTPPVAPEGAEESPYKEEVPKKEPEAPAEPEQPKRELATQFTVRDKDGDLEPHSVADLEYTFTANGKEKTVTGDKLVRLAQMGAYNEEREQAVVSTRQENAQLTQTLEKANGYIQRLAADLDAMYQDQTDETYIRARDAYRAKNTPEAQLQREREENQRLRREQADGAILEQAKAFTGHLQTKLTALATQHPEVPMAEILGQLEMRSLHLKSNGRVPPDQFAAYDRLVDSELTQWVQHTNEERGGKKTAAAAEAAKREKAAKTEAHLAKRQLTRTIPPAGTPPKGPGATEPPKPFKAERATDILKPGVIEGIIGAGTG